MNYQIKRDWHCILGHPGQTAQNQALDLAGIKGYMSTPNCETCVKTKITVSRGHGSLRSSDQFAEAIHMDLVGGQKSLQPTTKDTSVPNASWFLLAVDEYTAYKWTWPIHTKKMVPT